MKRIISGVFILILIMSMVGCYETTGDNDNSIREETTSESVKEDEEIPIVRYCDNERINTYMSVYNYLYPDTKLDKGNIDYEDEYTPRIKYRDCYVVFSTLEGEPIHYIVSAKDITGENIDSFYDEAHRFFKTIYYDQLSDARIEEILGAIREGNHYDFTVDGKRRNTYAYENADGYSIWETQKWYW